MKSKSIRFIAIFSVVFVACIYWFASRSTPAADKTPSSKILSGSSSDPSGTAADVPETIRTKSADRPPNSAFNGELDDDFKPANYQLRTMGDGTDAPTGVGIAYVQIPSTNRRVALQPNSLGEYEAQPTLTEETVGVRLRIEDVLPGTPVAVVILDGGSFPDGSGPSKIIKVGSDSQIAFRFTTSANIGYHRLRILPSGGTARMLDFTASKS